MINLFCLSIHVPITDKSRMIILSSSISWDEGCRFSHSFENDQIASWFHVLWEF